MNIRNIEAILSPPPIHWVGDGFRVHQFIPGLSLSGMERMNPFIMLDYASNHVFPPSEKPKGVGVHPHRGFETVTIAYKGRVAHHDSTGGGGVIGEGDVQWMTAASGILHKEYHEAEWSRKGGAFQMAQLWVNLPARYKMSAPKYQPITNDNMGKAAIPGDGGIIEVIAGSWQGTSGPATTFSPIHLLNARFNEGGTAPFSFPARYNTGLVVVEGSIRINDKKVASTDHFVLFGNQGEDFTLTAMEKSVVLVMSAEPLNEPIAAHGPFVMNTRQELIRAYEDFTQGKFGFLAD